MPPTFGNAALLADGESMLRIDFKSSFRDDSSSLRVGFDHRCAMMEAKPRLLNRCCPLSLALCAGAYWRALEARGLVRRLTGPFVLVAAPACTNRWFSTPAPGSTRPDHSPYSNVAGVYGQGGVPVKRRAAGLRAVGVSTTATPGRSAEVDAGLQDYVGEGRVLASADDRLGAAG